MVNADFKNREITIALDTYNALIETYCRYNAIKNMIYTMHKNGSYFDDAVLMLTSNYVDKEDRDEH